MKLFKKKKHIERKEILLSEKLNEIITNKNIHLELYRTVSKIKT